MAVRCWVARGLADFKPQLYDPATSSKHPAPFTSVFSVLNFFCCKKSKHKKTRLGRRVYALCPLHTTTGLAVGQANHADGNDDAVKRVHGSGSSYYILPHRCTKAKSYHCGLPASAVQPHSVKLDEVCRRKLSSPNLNHAEWATKSRSTRRRARRKEQTLRIHRRGRRERRAERRWVLGAGSWGKPHFNLPSPQPPAPGYFVSS